MGAFFSAEIVAAGRLPAKAFGGIARFVIDDNPIRVGASLEG